jgi:hypothetical protein
MVAATAAAERDRMIVDLLDPRLPPVVVVALTRMMSKQDDLMRQGRGREALAFGSAMRMLWHTAISPSNPPPQTNFGELR